MAENTLSTNHFDTVAEVIRARRTHKQLSPEPIAGNVIDELLDLAAHAPNHRMTQPWRFSVLDRAGIERFSAWLAEQADIAAWPDPQKGPAKLTKIREHYLANLGALIQVTWVRDSDPERDLEDHAAVCSAVQNILLGATACGLASFWSSSAAMRHPRTLEWFGADPATESFVASIWLASPITTPATPPRSDLSTVVRRP